MANFKSRMAKLEAAAAELPPPDEPPLAARISAAAIAAGLARAAELQSQGVNVECGVVHGSRSVRRMLGAHRWTSVRHVPHAEVAKAALEAGVRELAAMNAEQAADASHPTERDDTR